MPATTMCWIICVSLSPQLRLEEVVNVGCRGGELLPTAENSLGTPREPCRCGRRPCQLTLVSKPFLAATPSAPRASVADRACPWVTQLTRRIRHRKCESLGAVSNPDLLLYAVHVALWSSFGVAWLFLRNPGFNSEKTGSEPVSAPQEYTAPFSRSVLGFHLFGFAVLYFGIANAVVPGRMRIQFPGQRGLGIFIIAVGAALIAWAVASFHSWRFRAKLDQGHQLATSGAFQLLRHPIYAGVNAIALGSAIWAPTVVTWSAVLLIVLGSELRARSEEAVLRQAFGSRYVDYCGRTKRFIPGFY
jgi:protein-S-isoprenylcysteine O-methyltransferase Ste14